MLAEANAAAREHGVEGDVENTSGGGKGKGGRGKGGGRRTRFPDHLPHFRTTYELSESDRQCHGCGDTMREIGEDASKELERIETSLVHEIVRKKYACSSCGECAKTAPGPARVIAGGLLAPGFLAHVITERFLNHMPYNRQEKKYGSEGLALSRTVLERSAAKCAELLKPIYDEIACRHVACRPGSVSLKPSRGDLALDSEQHRNLASDRDRHRV